MIYSKAIQFGEHFDDIMKLPCVFRAEKVNGHWVFLMLDKDDEIQYVRKGDWICEINGKYFLVTKEEWEAEK